MSDKMTQHNEYQESWWGRFSVDEGQTSQWQIGPLKLAVQRLLNEWQLAYERDEIMIEEANGWQLDQTALDVNSLGYAQTERYTFGQTSSTLWVLPALADRPVVTRPWTPFYVTAGEETVMFVSSPLWVRIAVDDPPKILQEIPIRRPSDTWFGPSTMEGELCYASRTHGRLNFENVALQPQRAIIEVIIRNRADTTLLVERLSLPVPYLSLFETPEGLLWTESVTMVRTRDTGMATFDLVSRPPVQAGQAKLVSEPRQTPSRNMVIRAFGALFG
jgi:hypothetical protein